ncbi:MAG: GntR family transcriptional regulator [Candidatus Hydrogenedentes bacterium]|nr:GntR family transcriptional regulator [Candidatus Hydrogenedentota bacterium]
MTQTYPESINNYSICERIKREIKGRIDRKELAEGNIIASENELSSRFGISRNLARQALRELEIEGYIIRSRGRRSVVAPPSRRRQTFFPDGSRVVAIAVHDQHCLHTRTVVDGFVSQMAKHRFQTVTYNLRFDPEDEVRFIEHIPATNVAGACLWVQYDQPETRQVIQRYCESGFPVVLIDRYLPEVDVDFAVSDNHWLGYSLTRALLERGHRIIGFAADGDNVASGRDRFEGYRRALQEADVPFRKSLYGVFSEQTASEAARLIMAEREAPTAFCCIHDTSAEHLARELSRLGYTVPEHIELAAVDDERIPESAHLSMITLRQPARVMGREAARLLLARIREPYRAFEQRFLREESVLQEEVLPAPPPCDKVAAVTAG